MFFENAYQYIYINEVSYLASFVVDML